MANQVTKSIIVRRNVESLYDVWSNFETFPHFMKYIRSIEKIGELSSRWVMEGPLGFTIEWEAETTRLEENKRIAWSSKDQQQDGNIKTSGQVTFNPLSPEETEVTVMLRYVPPAGVTGKVLAELFGDPEGNLMDDLRNFKAYTEGMPKHISRVV